MCTVANRIESRPGPALLRLGLWLYILHRHFADVIKHMAKTGMFQIKHKTYQ